MQREIAIGIDLGTTISKMAYVDQNGDVRMIPNAEGSFLTPSIVGITESGERVVGELAKRQLILHPERTVRDIKRLMGTNQKVKLGDREYTPQEISAMILQKLKRDAEAFLGTTIKKAVISVPAHFDDNQRTATKEAGEIAGLEVIRVFAEPTAAALAYGLDKELEARILVFDLGGGTLDVSLLEVGEGVFEVKCVSGDTHLGGRDFDQAIVNWLIDEFKKETGIDLSKDRAALQRLHDAAEKAKHELSNLTQTTISLPFIAADATGPKHLERTLTRAQFEAMCSDLVERCRKCIDRVLEDAKLSKDQIHKVILIGGSTRMPMIRRMVRDYFGRDPLTDINPDEAVARGAATQAAILTGQIKKEILLVDVTPLTLGVEVLGGMMEPIIPRNTKIPCRKEKIFTTAHDYQTNVEIRAYQGERPMAADNRFLGSFVLDGIPPAPRGVPQIEVTFDIDANGILQITAKDLGTGKSKSITIHRPGALPREEIERMIREAKEYEEQDKKRRELAETKNNAESLIYNVEKALREVGDKIDKSKQDRVRKSIEELREVLGKVQSPDEIQKLKDAIDKLNREAGEVFAELYKREYKPPEEKKS